MDAWILVPIVTSVIAAALLAVERESYRTRETQRQAAAQEERARRELEYLRTKMVSDSGRFYSSRKTGPWEKNRRLNDPGYVERRVKERRSK